MAQSWAGTASCLCLWRSEIQTTLLPTCGKRSPPRVRRPQRTMRFREKTFVQRAGNLGHSDIYGWMGSIYIMILEAQLYVDTSSNVSTSVSSLGQVTTIHHWRVAGWCWSRSNTELTLQAPKDNYCTLAVVGLYVVPACNSKSWANPPTDTKYKGSVNVG